MLFSNPPGSRVRFDVAWLAEVGDAPFFTTVPPTVVTAGRAYAYTAQATDPEDDPINYELGQAPAGLTIDGLSGAVAWSPQVADAGSHTVELVAEDVTGNRATQRFTLEVRDGSVNEAPTFTTSPATRAPTGTRYTYDAGAFDPDGDTLAFTLIAGPPGATMGSSDGLLVWDFTLPGSYPVDVEVADGFGGFARQEYVLVVGAPAVNATLPRLFGSPAPTAIVDELYLYQPIVDNPDLTETVTFSLTSAPTGMAIDPLTGRVTWTPTSDQTSDQIGVSTATLRADDGNGGAATQTWTIEVFAVAPNRAPVIDTLPTLEVTLGDDWIYDANATDPDGDLIGYALVAPPAGMTIDADSGRIDWTPTTTGTFLVALRATDPSGAFGAQAFELDVVPVNNPPTITSTLDVSSLAVGQLFGYQPVVDDPDGDVLTFDLIEAPEGMEIHPQFGTISWTPRASQSGDQAATLRVRDGRGGEDRQDLLVTVVPDLNPPSIQLAISQSPAATLVPFQVCVEADDDVGVASIRLLVDGVDTELDIFGCKVFEFDVPTTLQLRGEVLDTGQNLAVEEVTQDVLDPDEGLRPVVVPESLVPAPGSVLATPSELLATIIQPDSQGGTLTIDSWEVRLARGDGPFEVIATGAGEVFDGEVAKLDTSLLANDTYRVQIEASNSILTGGVEYELNVTGNNKTGRYRLQMTDATYGVAGFPIAIARNYDSVETEPREFGIGWSLGLAGSVTDTKTESMTGIPLADLLGNEPFTNGTRVYVTRPDGVRVGFTLEAVGTGNYLNASIKYVPDEGVNDTLRDVNDTQILWAINGQLFEFTIPYNPSTYVLTTNEGVAYTIDEFDGLIAIEGPEGDRLDVVDSGIFGSDGSGIEFVRDVEDRITEIRSVEAGAATPAATLTYAYDGQGRLERSGYGGLEEFEYRYEAAASGSLLTKVIDPEGAAMVTVAFDADGRIVAECPDGADVQTLVGCRQVSYDLDANEISTLDSNGNRIDYTLDDRGNPIHEQRFLTPVDVRQWTYTYDAGDRETSRTGPTGDTFQFAYDGAGRLTQLIEPGGETWTATHDECGIVEQCDPLGDCQRLTYNEDCVLISFEEADGSVTTVTDPPDVLETSIIEPTGVTWVDRFDPDDGFLDEKLSPAGLAELYDVTATGDLVSVTDETGRSVTYVTDADSRLEQELWNDSGSTTFDYTYNTRGDLLSAEDGTTRVEYDYEVDGALASLVVRDIATDATRENVYFHDANNNVTAIDDAFGGRTEYDYDALNRLTEIRQTGTGVIDKKVTIEYDELTRAVTTRYFTGIASVVPDVETIRTYTCWDCPDRGETIVHRTGAGALIEQIDLVRDMTGNVVQMTDGDGVHTFTYDSDWRVIAVDRPGSLPDESYVYDASGNRISSHLSSTGLIGYDDPTCATAEACGNELLEDDDAFYVYNAAGEQEQRIDRTTGETLTSTYDHRSRIRRIERRDATDTLLDSIDVEWDAADRRMGWTDAGGTTGIHMVGLNPALEYDDQGQVIRRRLYTLGLDQVFAEEEGGVVRWLLRDANGSITHTWANGSLAGRRSYDSFGRVTSGSAGGATLGFHARPEVGYGLLDFRARLYDPETGRFLSRDPLPMYDYTFLENNGFKYRDPMGRSVAVEYACLAVHVAHNAVTVVSFFTGFTGEVMKGMVGAFGDGGADLHRHGRLGRRLHRDGGQREEDHEGPRLLVQQQGHRRRQIRRQEACQEARPQAEEEGSALLEPAGLRSVRARIQ